MHQHPQKAFLIDITNPDISSQNSKFRKTEFLSLVRSISNIAVVQIVQQKSPPDYHTYLQSQLIDEILEYQQQQKFDLLILNNILKSGQIFALTELLEPYEVQAWDRVDLILNIFSAHAQSTEAKLQIELARIRHMGPRIFGMGMELSQQGGGIGTSGIGETNIERMKRHLKEQERRVSKKLGKVSQSRELQRQRRRRQNLKTIALVGYTNAGKSSLMRVLTKKENIPVDNALFVTLDTKIGRLFLPEIIRNVLVADTIGFITDLPPDLIAAFTSTLSEAIHADLLLHVVDVSDPEREQKIAVVDEILNDLGIDEKQQILACNKVDKAGKRFGKIKLRQRYKSRTPIFLSATKKENLGELKKRIGKILF